MRRSVVLCLLASLLVSVVCVAAQEPKPTAQTAAAAPQLPPAATDAKPADADAPKPIPIAVEDITNIVNSTVDVAGLQRAIQTLQKELDAAEAESKRAFARAQAKHPDMPIHTQTWMYMPPRTASDKSGGQQ